jgi:hypothetical protein
MNPNHPWESGEGPSFYYTESFQRPIGEVSRQEALTVHSTLDNQLPVREGEVDKITPYPFVTHMVRNSEIGSIHLPASKVRELRTYVGPGFPSDWSSQLFNQIRTEKPWEIASHMRFLIARGGRHTQARLRAIDDNFLQFVRSERCPPLILIRVRGGNPLLDGRPYLTGIGQTVDGNGRAIGVALGMTPTEEDWLVPAYVLEIGQVRAMITDFACLVVLMAAERTGRVFDEYVHDLRKLRMTGDFVDVAQFLPQKAPQHS